MKKLLSLLTGGLIKDVGNVIDKLTTTDEERLAAKQKIQELLEKAEFRSKSSISSSFPIIDSKDTSLNC